MPTGHGNAGVLVRSTLSDVRLHVVNRGDDASDAFSPLPVSALGTEYRALGHPDFKQSRCELLIVAVKDRTRVHIRLTSQTVEYNDKTYTDGDIIAVELNRLSSFHLIVNNEDLAGIEIIASDPVSVVESTSRSGAHSSLQLVPVQQWSADFLVASFPGTRGDRIRCVVFTAGEFRVNGQVIRTPLYEIIAEEPGIRLSFSSAAQCANYGDTGTTTALLIVPIGQYITGIQRTSVMEAGHGSIFSMYALVSVNSNDRSNIRKDDASIPENSWKEINGMVCIYFI